MRHALVCLMVLSGLLLPAHARARQEETPPPPLFEEEQLQPSPLKRKDLPPFAVAGLLTFTSEGSWDNPCYVRATRPVLTPACEVTIPGGVLIGVSDFAPDTVVDVVVQRPDGSRVERRLELGGQFASAGWEWLALPGDLVGTHQISATGQTHAVRTTLEVNPPRPDPWTFAFPGHVSAGTEAGVALTGFEPQTSVPLELHRSLRCDANTPHGTYTFVTQLAPIVTDAAGQAIVYLPTSEDDPACWYTVETQPSSARLFVSQFKLEGALPAADSADIWAPIIDEASRVQATLLALERAPIDNVNRVYGEPLRSEVRSEWALFRGAGRYLEVRQLGETRILAMRHLPFDYVKRLPPTDGFDLYGGLVEVIASEHWDTRQFGRDGTLLEHHDRRETWRYVLRLVPADPGAEKALRWLIVEIDRLDAE